MANKYYDEKYLDHIVFFDEPMWLTTREWTHNFPDTLGSYDRKLVKGRITDDTKLPFMYRAKHPKADYEYMIEKQIKDGTCGYCNNRGLISV